MMLTQYHRLPIKIIMVMKYLNKDLRVSLLIWGGVSKVSDYLFNGVTPIKSVTFKDNINLTEIGSHAFDGTSLTFLTLPDTVETLGEFAFGNINTLNSVNIPEKLTTADRAFAGSKKLNELRNKIEGTRIPDGMFENTGLTTFIVPQVLRKLVNMHSEIISL